MRPKSFILLALALGCGIAASIGISQVMDANANKSGPKLETTPIYIALHNINLGDPINASMVALEEWPSEKAPKGSITSLEELEGRRARTTIITGTPILEAQLLAVGEFADPIVNIPDGFRLSTISVNAEKSAAGLLSPGDRVDISLFVSANARAGIPMAMTKVILQNVRVFAVEQSVQRSADEEGSDKNIPKTVSLLVTPEQASSLDLAGNLGELSLIPRNPNDEGTAKVADITVADLLGTGSKKNTRVAEQNRVSGRDQPKKPSLFSSVMGMMRKAAEERPPFRMEIVEADEVHEMLFNASTGAPLRGEQEEYSGQRGRVSATPAAYAPDGRLDFTPKKKSSDSSDDFPIDFEDE